MKKWIHTRDNLFKRGILNIDSQHCVLGCGCDRSILHLFFACDMSCKVWCGVIQWLGIQIPFNNNQVVHAHHFNELQVLFLKYKKCFQVIWLTTISIIWKVRNDYYFNNKTIVS
jgi:hypothetical protein